MQAKSNVFGQLGRRSAAHPWITVALWVVMAAIIVIAGSNVTAFDPDSEYTINVESEMAATVANDAFGSDGGADELIVIHSDVYTINDPEFRAVADRFVANLDPFQNDIVAITYYYDAPEVPAMQQLVSADQNSLLIPIALHGEWSDYDSRWSEFERILNASEAEGFFIGGIGDITSGEISEIIADDMASELRVGIPAALIVMIIVFGALVAAGLPLLLGIATIGIGTAIVTLLGSQIFISDIAFTMVSMIGLAVGIDYSLVLVERYRQERNSGHSKLDAIEIASATAGKAVFFSGITTTMALFGVFLVPMMEFQGMGLAMAVAVVVAVCAALTLLPALVALVGNWINFPRFDSMRRLREQDAGVRLPREIETRHGAWGKVSRAVVKRPMLSFVGVTLILILAALPTFTMELGQSSAFQLPESRFVHSFEIVAEDFAAGMESPIRIVLRGDAATADNAAEIQAELAQNPVFGPATVLISEDGSVIMIESPLTVETSSAAAQTAVSDLRSTSTFARAGNDVLVGGGPAEVYDFGQVLRDSLPKVLLFVLSLSFVVMMLAFRSITVPLLSVFLNLLSVGAAYGSVVLVFQHGFMADQLGLIQVESIVNWLPIILFCILFGLSMDYHVFVLSRIREAWDRSHNVDESIVDGINHTGHIITGAAVIMMAVFGSFAIGHLAEMQQMGFGLALAVFIDVMLVRSILLPAGLKLLGKSAWWWPGALHWVPNLQIEGHATTQA
ncbi:MAG: MMPL family transporter [Thermomicrobiales bacterium]|nr:MMPL family transporter [Thermomicrobiales bacterium]